MSSVPAHWSPLVLPLSIQGFISALRQNWRISVPASWPGRWSTERIADALALAIIGAVAIIAAFTFRDYGLGWDDYVHAEYGGLLLNLYSSGFTDQRALSFVNLYAYGGGFDLLSALAAKVLPFDLFETRRLMGAVIGIIGISLTWRLGRRIGGPLGSDCGRPPGDVPALLRQH